MSLSTDYTIVYIEHPKDSAKIILEKVNSVRSQDIRARVFMYVISKHVDTEI